MKKRETFFLILSLSGILCFSQNPLCSNGFVYMDGGSFISAYNPSLPLSTTNPAPTNIPTFGGGLTLMPNISGGTLSPTFYSVSGGNYWYWNGAAWVNTGHSTGNSAAVNLAGCGGILYNLVGGTGQVYSYNGTGNGSLLTTLSGFNGGGPYDLVTDCNCNFYALNTTVPNQGLSMYSPTGALQCTYTLSGMPSAGAGGGFAIIGNMIYVKNNGTPGFYIGTISGGGVTFTAVTGFNNSPGDFASCPVCYGSTSIAGAVISGALLNCSTPSANIAVSTTASPVTYAWTGPGIIGPGTGSITGVNAPGTYSCVITTAACPPQQSTLVTTVISNSNIVTAALTPSGNICLAANGNKELVVAHTSTYEAVFWTGPGFSNITNTDSINVTIAGLYSVTVIDPFSGCYGTASITVNNTPTVSLALSDNTLCLQNYNGSSASITITPSGATSYTLLTSSNYSTSSPNGPVMPCNPVTIFGSLSPNATGTLIGSNGSCSDTATTFFTIIPNPTISLSVTNASICPGGSKVISASGAAQYQWGGNFGLNTYSGNNVIASPNVPSLYSVIGDNGLGCSSQTQTVSVNILPVPTITVNPAASIICLGSVLTLTAVGTATAFSWAPATGLLTSSTNALVNVSPPNTMIYSVIGSLNSCTNSASALVNVVQPPVLALSLTNYSMCAQNYNNSPNSIILTPSGAVNYTLLAGSGISVGSPNGPSMVAIPSGPMPTSPAVITVTLVGSSSVCNVSITKTLVVVPNPAIYITPSTGSVCPGHSQVFMASGASNYSWLPTPHYTVTGNNSIIANPPLTSFYSVIGSDSGCNSDIKKAVLVILPIPEVTVTPFTSTLCAGNSVTLAADGNATSYNWSPSASLSSSYGSLVTATPLTFQTYTVIASLNTCTNQAVGSVSVIVVPVIHASASQPTICSDASTNLNVIGANSYQWFPTDNLNYSSGNSVIASPNESTTYTVHGYNGECTGATTIFIQTIKRPDMELKATSNEVCIGNSIPISVSGAQSYTWIPLNGLFPTGSNTLVIAAPLVSTDYTVIGANSMGSVSCYQRLSYSVVVIPVIKPAVSEDVYLCEGEKTVLYASGGNSYSWTPSYGLNINNGAGVVANPSITTIYTVEVSYNSYCGRTTTVMVAVNPKPNVYAGRDTSYNLNEVIFIEANGTGTLTWVRGEDIICTACPRTQVYPTRDGCYVVEAVNDVGCKATDDICIGVTEDFSFYLPNSFTPNNDGINDEFLIFGENISQVSMEIYDRWGVKIFHSEDFFVGWNGKYNGISCPEGVYTYVVRYTGLNRRKYTANGHVSIIK